MLLSLIINTIVQLLICRSMPSAAECNGWEQDVIFSSGKFIETSWQKYICIVFSHLCFLLSSSKEITKINKITNYLYWCIDKKKIMNKDKSGPYFNHLLGIEPPYKGTFSLGYVLSSKNPWVRSDSEEVTDAWNRYKLEGLRDVCLH